MMFVVCQGTCFCAGKAEGFNRQKVLYCFGEVRQSATTRDLSLAVIIAGGHREAEHEGGGGGEVGPGGGSVPPPGGSDAGHPRQSPCCVSSLIFQNISVGF